MRTNAPPAAVDEGVYAEYGQNIQARDPHTDTHPIDTSCVIDPNSRKFYQTYGPQQGMRNDYAHIWERPLPQPSFNLTKYPQPI